ncbi:MAG TPA: hypothetical protein VF789_27695 [Thermoanaerobaculia bacterium]
MTTRYLPSATLPWGREIERRHQPAQGHYSSYKPCLRWEFGFSCAFCLLHESDLMFGGISGWAVMQVEHSVPRSQYPFQRDAYSNCFYICERCNKHRGAIPNQDDRGNILLDPCNAVWSEHFELVNDRLRPRSGDGDAEYTWESYSLDDPVKVRLRERRRQWIEKHADALLDTLELEPEVLGRFVEESADGEVAELLKRLDEAQGLRKARRLLLENLARFEPVPKDHDIACRCGHNAHHSLPEVLAEQAVGLAELLQEAQSRKSGNVNR